MALPWADLQMAHIVVNHARCDVVVEDTAAPFLEDMCLLTTIHVEAKRSAAKRWIRKKCGGTLHCPAERGPYVKEFQHRMWFAGPRAPPLVDTVAAWGLAIHGAILDADAAESREFRDAGDTDLIDSDDALRERPPKYACAL